MRRVCCSIGAALLLCAAAGPATARPIMDWDPALFYEDQATPTSSIAGKEMQIVGVISVFGGPLEFLNANMPGKQYTFFMYGMISNGTSPPVAIPGLGNIYTTTYGFTPPDTARIEVYEDAVTVATFDPNPPNATVPSRFIDGTLILAGNVSGFYWQSDDFATGFDSGVSEASIQWTGGLHFDKVQAIGGDVCPGLFTGGITWHPLLMQPYPGYVFRHDGKIDLECPTPARSSTWGRLKSLYR